ncbi:MAG TPA: D-alanyl-D-alanine dipeptidase [Magnetospirillum sp.]|nr:D-alanyl-D-alanine dipeptidase [Magnetospirillum sp.]
MFPLVEITPDEFDVEIALAYATADNFTGRPVYAAQAGCFLHAEAATLLRRAAELARPLGLRLRVLDAFRPSEAQWVLWNHSPDPEFLADPRRGSLHSMGAAVDLTLVRRDTGQALDMGTAFDAFTPRSHHGDQAIGAEAQRNRHLLLGIMTTAGWDHYKNEWWHYQLPAARDKFPLLGNSVLGRRSMMPG